MQAILSPAYTPAGPTTNSSTAAVAADQSPAQTQSIPNAETLIALLKQQEEELAEQQRLTKEMEQKDLYQAYLKNQLHLKAGMDLIKKRQDEQLFKTMPGRENPRGNSRGDLRAATTLGKRTYSQDRQLPEKKRGSSLR